MQPFFGLSVDMSCSHFNQRVTFLLQWFHLNIFYKPQAVKVSSISQEKFKKIAKNLKNTIFCLKEMYHDPYFFFSWDPSMDPTPSFITLNQTTERVENISGTEHNVWRQLFENLA